MSNFLNRFNSTTVILISLAIILLAGFLMTRLTKRAKLPNVTGFILAGVVIGPYVLKIIPLEVIDGMGFVSDLALAFIAFGVGRFFKKEAFRETGVGIVIITLFESLVAGLLITLAMRFIFNFDWQFSLLLGAIATATAPASTMATIRQYHARGNFVNTLLQVVAFDDAVCLIVFSIAIVFVNASSALELSAWHVILPIFYNILLVGLGALSGYLLSKLVNDKRSTDNRLILTITFLLGISGLCAALDISPLLTCMVFGTTYINLTRDKYLFRELEMFTPPILAIFFVVSGMNLNLGAFSTLGVIGVAYFVIRIAGKYLGAYVGSSLANASLQVRNYLGLALIPQAGVAIGLAFLGKRMLVGPEGDILLTIILSSSVLYELIGPASAKYALFKSGDIKAENMEGKTVPTSKVKTRARLKEDYAKS